MIQSSGSVLWRMGPARESCYDITKILKYVLFRWVYVDIWSLFIKWDDAGKEDLCVFPKRTLTPPLKEWREEI